MEFDRIRNRLYEDNVVFLDVSRYSTSEVYSKLRVNCNINVDVITVQMIRSFDTQDMHGDINYQIEERFILKYKEYEAEYEPIDVPLSSKFGMVKFLARGSGTAYSITYQKHSMYIIVTLMTDEQYYLHVNHMIDEQHMNLDRNKIDKFCEYIDVNGILLRNITERDVRMFNELHL